MRRSYLGYSFGGSHVARLFLPLALALVVPPGASNAALLTSVSFKVTGGTFDGPFSSGPITGGNILFTLSVPTNTPQSTLSTYVSGTWKIALKGPSGAFRETRSARGGFFPHVNGIYVTQYTHTILKGPISNENLSPPGWGGFFWGMGPEQYNCVGNGPVYAPGSFCQINTPNRPYNHRFTVGSEVRTFVPEPATGALVALGLVLMGVVGGSGRVTARALRGIGS